MQPKAQVNFCYSTGFSGYFISYAPVNFSLAHSACFNQGGALAKATESNYFNIKDLILDCIGENQSGWIGAWNSRVESEKCLELSTDFDDEKPTVDINCKANNHAICYSNEAYHGNKQEKKEPLLVPPSMKQ